MRDTLANKVAKLKTEHPGITRGQMAALLHEPVNKIDRAVQTVKRRKHPSRSINYAALEREEKRQAATDRELRFLYGTDIRFHDDPAAIKG